MSKNSPKLMKFQQVPNQPMNSAGQQPRIGSVNNSVQIKSAKANKNGGA